MEILQRELVYVWYYFSVQLEQIFWFWVLGMVLGSFVAVFAKNVIHRAVGRLPDGRLRIASIASQAYSAFALRCACMAPFRSLQHFRAAACTKASLLRL